MIMYLMDNAKYLLYTNEHQRFINKMYPLDTENKNSQVSDSYSVSRSKRSSVPIAIKQNYESEKDD